MKIQKSLTIALSIVISPFEVAAQSSKAEQEVRAFVAAYDKAVASRDITFLQHVIPDDYVFTGASGRKSDRAQVLNFLRSSETNRRPE